MTRIIAIVFVLAAACGNVRPAEQPAPDSSADAVPPPPPPPPVPGQELAVAAGHLTGGTWTVDVHLGSAINQASASGGGSTVSGGTPIHP